MLRGEDAPSFAGFTRGIRREAEPMSAGITAAPALQNLAAGDILGRYELLLPVAQGGMATVWAARMKGTRGFSKIVAIKTMLPALSSDPRFEKMFLSEAELASRIKHPNVCEILDLGEQEGVLYLAMEWIDGESLVTLLGDCERAGLRIPFAAAAHLGADAARGLHAAHELKDEAGELVGVVHRDVSPHNILVTYDGIVKIVDFGVAKAMARTDHQATNAGHLKGKVHFMAPEQAFCDEVDRRTDVFALGIVLYQLTTGNHPFRADNELATLARITSPEPVPDPSMHVADYPPELAAVLLKALAKEPAQRFASMRDFADALEAVEAKLGAGGAQGFEAFLHEALGSRHEARAAQLKEGRRAADERAERRAIGASATPLPGLAVVAAPHLEDTHGPIATPIQPSRGGFARAAGLVSLGAILGAVALIWATRGASTSALSSSSLSAALTTTLPPPPSASPVAPAPSIEATSAITTTTSASAPVLAASAPVAAASASARPSLKAAVGAPRSTAVPPKSGGVDKFRNPGF
jgi:serine/threonine-protein kinase